VNSVLFAGILPRANNPFDELSCPANVAVLSVIVNAGAGVEDLFDLLIPSPNGGFAVHLRFLTVGAAFSARFSSAAFVAAPLCGRLLSRSKKAACTANQKEK